MKKTNFQNNKGFTLIEMLVSVALFTIVVTIAMGTIFTIIDANRKSQSLAIVINNLNFSLESITRSVKTANPNTISVSIDNSTLSLTDQNGQEISYILEEDTLKKRIRIETAYSIIPSDVVIEDAEFRLLRPNSSSQPRIFVYIKGYAQITEKTRSDFVIQTTITPRKLKI